MVRLSRAEQQRHNRARVLAAAREEFSEVGFRDAKIDRIAERAERTRGAVYSNFPSKRALYFAVVADLVTGADTHPSGQIPAPADPAEAVASIARAWVTRLPLANCDDHQETAHLIADVFSEVRVDEMTRQAFAQLMKLDTIVLGLALEGLATSRTTGTRHVKTAEAVLITLHGANQMAAAAPGFIEPFDVITACTTLASTDFHDQWTPPDKTIISPARPTRQPWSVREATDVVSGQPAPLDTDGVAAILGLHKLQAIEQAVRAAPAGLQITAVLVTDDPPERIPLARLVLDELFSCLRNVLSPSTLRRLAVVLDDDGSIAHTAGIRAVSDETETALRIHNGHITARADGLGACHSAATWPTTRAARTSRPENESERMHE